LLGFAAATKTLLPFGECGVGFTAVEDLEQVVLRAVAAVVDEDLVELGFVGPPAGRGEGVEQGGIGAQLV
jgi:hypothetical protein